MHDEFSKILDFVAGEIVELVNTSNPDIAPDDSERMAFLAVSLIESQNLNDTLVRRIKARLNVK